jgi:hypothetical protein
MNYEYILIYASPGDISGSWGDEYEDGCLLGCCTM